MVEFGVSAPRGASSQGSVLSRRWLAPRTSGCTSSGVYLPSVPVDSAQQPESAASVAQADPGCRLGWYFDAVYGRAEGSGELRTISETYPFLIFATAVGQEVDRLVLFGREAPASMDGVDFPVGGSPDLVPLPHYESVSDLVGLARSLPRTVRAMWGGLAKVDRVVVFGPHPFSVVFVLLALLRRKGVVLGVRQDTMAYFRARLSGQRSLPLMAPIWVLDRISRLLSRRLPTAVVGEDLERDYGGPRKGLLMMRPTLVAADDVVDSRTTDISRSRSIDILTVGRVAPEKVPELFVSALSDLDQDDPGRFRATWVGDGEMSDQVREFADGIGLHAAFEMPGFVPFGDALLRRYRECDLFVHTAITEGSPQVLIEAMASGAPIVATDVGSVRAALDDGRAGLIVPPNDRQALVAAIRRLVDDDELRQQLSCRAIDVARTLTLEVEAGRFAAFAAPDKNAGELAPPGGVPGS